MADTDAAVPADEGMIMLHPGLPLEWMQAAALAMGALALWSLIAPLPAGSLGRECDPATGYAELVVRC